MTHKHLLPLLLLVCCSVLSSSAADQSSNPSAAYVEQRMATLRSEKSYPEWQDVTSLDVAFYDNTDEKNPFTERPADIVHIMTVNFNDTNYTKINGSYSQISKIVAEKKRTGGRLYVGSRNWSHRDQIQEYGAEIIRDVTDDQERLSFFGVGKNKNLFFLANGHRASAISSNNATATPDTKF